MTVPRSTVDRQHGTSRKVARAKVAGIGLDAETRCVHYHSARDIVAIKMLCCGTYYACVHCHEALAGHAIDVWPARHWHSHAIRCGKCGVEMSIADYLASGDRCPHCAADFNPHCKDHHHFYFADGTEAR